MPESARFDAGKKSADTAAFKGEPLEFRSLIFRHNAARYDKRRARAGKERDFSETLRICRRFQELWLESHEKVQRFHCTFRALAQSIPLQVSEFSNS